MLIGVTHLAAPLPLSTFGRPQVCLLQRLPLLLGVQLWPDLPTLVRHAIRHHLLLSRLEVEKGLDGAADRPAPPVRRPCADRCWPQARVRPYQSTCAARTCQH